MADNTSYFQVAAPISVTSVTCDSIAERTSAGGVTIDGCLVKDGRVAGLATASFFMSEPVTGNGAAQNTAHGFGTIPTLTYAVPVDLTGGVYAVIHGTHTTTNCIFTVTTGEKYRVVAFK